MFKLIRYFIVVLVACKNEEMKALSRVFTAYTDFCHVIAVNGRIWLKFEHIQAFMHVLVFCKNEDDPIKNEGARVLTTFLHYKSIGIFPDAQ